ncbi:uncharacterized protein RSE6_03387 [Rhynchosporium secalis]|uniref:Uncharacterized protein n=1 Tax=Rhynchosporium secalis TaxID=38038 RepID=A0A1E1M2N4_RHYSE|nr:uncharacterized protein RSE6_03387 [Rhynchosporium secalis]
MALFSCNYDSVSTWVKHGLAKRSATPHFEQPQVTAEMRLGQLELREIFRVVQRYRLCYLGPSPLSIHPQPVISSAKTICQ